jgi:hypothetical protein
MKLQQDQPVLSASRSSKNRVVCSRLPRATALCHGAAKQQGEAQRPHLCSRGSPQQVRR